MLRVKLKYQIFEAHSKFNQWRHQLTYQKPLIFWKNVKKDSKSVLVFGVCLVEPHDFYDLFCHGCKRKISKRKRTLVAIEPGTADEMCSSMTTVI